MMGSKPNYGKITAWIYALTAFAAWAIAALKGINSIWVGISIFLTLPWSISLIFFAWAIAHDGVGSLFLLFWAFIGLNAYLLKRLVEAAAEE